MKYLLASLFILAGCSELDLTLPVSSCSGASVNTYTKGKTLQTILDSYSRKGIPGIAVAIRKGNEYWTGASGFASIEQHMIMQPCNIQYGQSIAKTYTAVTILQLVEKGKIDLDQSIQHYLPSSIHTHIKHSNIITPRMLLNHTSGIYDYAYDYAYAMYLLNNGDKVFSSSLILDYILDKKPQFYPGSKYSYCNSGYVILAHMAEYVSGTPHRMLIRENISDRLDLHHTFYREEVKDVIDQGLVNCYLDRFSNGQLENVSKPQLNNILAMMGDDSVVATPLDYINFLDGLLSGKLISESMLAEMKQWVQDTSGKPTYGLGLDYTTEQGVVGYGHGGSGLGAGGFLFSFPEKDVTIYLGVNISTLIPSKATDALDKMKQEILALVFNN